MLRVITGFHAIEEYLKRYGSQAGGAASVSGGGEASVLYCQALPRVKRILELCKKYGIGAKQEDKESLDRAVLSLPEGLRDHRGVVLLVEGAKASNANIVDFDTWLSEYESSPNTDKCIVVILDGITDEHNAGAVIRSCDQFGVSLVVLPERGGASSIAGNAVIAKSSAGASEWVNISVVKNLSRTIRKLKDARFWVYKADAKGKRADEVEFAERTALVMGSEGSGARRLVAENCDESVAIPTCGKIDSLNVSVAAGILLYEIRMRGA